MLRALIPFLLLLTSCSHSYYTQDRSNPQYYTGGSRIYPINFLGSVKRVSDSPGKLHSEADTTGLESTTMVAETAAAGVIASGISLLVNKDYYKSPYISGTCLCSAVKDSVIELPCSDMTLKLLDASGKEIQKVHTNDGDFLFPVVANKEYAIAVESLSYQPREELKKPLYLGDKVLIHLVPVPEEKLSLAK